MSVVYLIYCNKIPDLREKGFVLTLRSRVQPTMTEKSCHRRRSQLNSGFYIQEAKSDRCWCLAPFALVIELRIPAKGMTPPTFRASLPTSLNLNLTEAASYLSPWPFWTHETVTEGELTAS